MTDYLLSILIFLPLLAGFIVVLLPKSLEPKSKFIALAVSIINLLISIYLFRAFDGSATGYQFMEQKPWINLDLGNFGTFSIQYLLGVDGISLPMVLLAGIVMLAGAVSSMSIDRRPKAFYTFFLLLTSSIFGCFVSLDFFLFFLFFEFMLLPMYFLIGIWGGERREYAAMKFIIYTLVGSVFILVVMLAMGLSVNAPMNSETPTFTFDFRHLADAKNYISGSVLDQSSSIEWLGWPVRSILFILLLVGFGIKLPAVPFHTWLPDAHVEAPTSISVVLAGILLKVGGYGFLRIGIGFFPEEALNFAPWIAGLGVVSIIYGAFNAIAQDDLKKLIAYSSVSHMGFVFLGFAAFNNEGFNGAIYQMFSHGLLSSMLFLVVGVIYDRTHNRLIQNYRGLAGKMPLYTGAVIIAFFGSLGLPGISGFIGEFFSLLGGFSSPHLSKWFPSIAVLGIVLSAVYLLWALQRMFFGNFWVNRDLKDQMHDLNIKESILLYGLGALAILYGVWPALLLDVTNKSVEFFLQSIGQ
ncbi:complex I subunit 4 family protein [Jiulongibacter sediminis]|uniref:Oxidoreductase n=1 Tax=Jiulongibacter sediminis TaxID=1605367 RepID=A0A0N8H9G0_9BACT|nr:NADH-quinone oxidoreductase subunit M [Jiulongibacter sediminis]KPM47268.1 oxidoreductase [Jiulongibacter sediminis]TBX22826.1 oxidoreductase [Jiulongibacter sediminis]